MGQFLFFLFLVGLIHLPWSRKLFKWQAFHCVWNFPSPYMYVLLHLCRRESGR